MTAVEGQIRIGEANAACDPIRNGQTGRPRCLIGAVLATLIATNAGAAPPVPQRVAVITNPDWIVRPNGADIDVAYPKLAALLMIPGKAAIRCDVTTAGRLAGCTALDESPKGLGFGAAALSLAPAFDMRPKMIDGRPVEGGVVTIPLNFTPDPPPAEIASRMPLQPKPEMLALAQRAVDHVWIIEAFAVRTRGQLQEAATASLGQIAPDVRDRGVEAFRDAIDAAMPALRDQLAEILATRLEESELREMLALPRSEAADYLFRRQDLFGPATTRLFDETGSNIQDDARARFCKVQDCTVTPLVFSHEE